MVQRLADDAAGGPAAGVARRAEEVAAMPAHGTSALDLPSGVRATARDGVVTFGRTPKGGRERGRGTATKKQGAKPPPNIPVVSDDPAIGEILVPAEDLSRRVRELGEEVSRDYAGKNLLLIGVLKGAVFFLSDLMRHLDIPVEVDFMAVASYGSATKTSGVVRILKDLDAAIEGRDVLIVEDIVDSGLTLQYLLRNLAGRNPASLEVCALLTKPARRKVDLEHPLRRLRDSRPVRHRLRPRSCRALPQPSLRRRVGPMRRELQAIFRARKVVSMPNTGATLADPRYPRQNG